MNFRETEEYLLSLGNEVETMKLGLENIRALLAALGNPEKEYLKIQVAGTNGKGSVCAFLDSICLQAGIKPGVYTSPHLVSITERVRIGGIDIAEDEFARIATRVRETGEMLVAEGELETVPTFFEQVTAIALLAFSQAKVELAILETGLGGRYDAVTATNAEICALTRIDLDHQEYLGNTIAEIAAEKAAIITNETQTVVIGAQTRPVMALLRKHCRELGIEPINDGHDPWRLLADEGSSVKVSLTMHTFSGIRLSLVGNHQIENAQTAIQIVEALRHHGLLFDEENEKESQIVEGLKNAIHPGRLEYIGTCLLDGAHNVGGAKALTEYLEKFVPQSITLIFGAMRDKNVAEMAEILWPQAKTVILTTPHTSRSLSSEELFDLKPEGIDESKLVRTNSVDEAIDAAKANTSDNEAILITGSLYLVGEARKLLTREGK